jgi:hypothetical protein
VKSGKINPLSKDLPVYHPGFDRTEFPKKSEEEHVRQKPAGIGTFFLEIRQYETITNYLKDVKANLSRVIHAIFA